MNSVIIRGVSAVQDVEPVLEVRLQAKERPRHPGVTVRKVLFMEDCEPDNASQPWDVAPPVRHVARHEVASSVEHRSPRYEIAQLRPVARHVCRTWGERGHSCEVPFKTELVEYLKIIRALFGLADLHQAVTVLAVHRIGRVNSFLDSCQFHNSWRPVFSGFGFESEYADEHAWHLLYSVASEAGCWVRWLEQSKHQDEWNGRAEAVRQFARFVRNDVVPFARLGVFRGKSGGTFFEDVAGAMVKRISDGR